MPDFALGVPWLGLASAHSTGWSSEEMQEAATGACPTGTPAGSLTHWAGAGLHTSSDGGPQWHHLQNGKQTVPPPPQVSSWLASCPSRDFLLGPGQTGLLAVQATHPS